MFNLVRKQKRDISGELIKEQALKSKGVLLEVLSESIEKGNRLCPLLMGSACLGKACMFFMQFKSVDEKTGESTDFYNCAYVQTPLLLIELNRSIKILKEGKNV